LHVAGNLVLPKKSAPGYLIGACSRGGGGRQALVVVEDDELDLDAADGGLLLGDVEGVYQADSGALLKPPC
jgi:hypothetical protein